MRPSEILAEKRDEVLAVVARYPFTNPRVFGSVARGEDTEESDVDLLVEPSQTATYFDLAKLQDALEASTGRRFDVLTPGGLHPVLSPRILAEARRL